MAEGGSHEAEERKSHKKINQTNEKINKERKNQKYFSPQKKKKKNIKKKSQERRQ